MVCMLGSPEMLTVAERVDGGTRQGAVRFVALYAFIAGASIAAALG